MISKLSSDVLRFLRDDPPDQGFPSSQIAANFGREESEMQKVLEELRRSGLAHRDQGNWYPGPEPSGFDVDQIN